jgi:hypothetical protein
MKKFYMVGDFLTQYETLKSAMDDANLHNDEKIVLYEKQDDTDWYKKGVYVRDGLGWQYVPWKYHTELTPFKSWNLI